MSANLHYASNQGERFSILEHAAPEAQEPSRLPSTGRFVRQLVLGADFDPHSAASTDRLRLLGENLSQRGRSSAEVDF